MIRRRLPPWLDRALWWCIAPLAVAFAYWTAVHTEFVGDARLLVLDNRLMASLEHLWGNLTHNYFWSSSGRLIPYWRPVTKVSWLLEHQLFGGWAGGYALVQVGWHVLGVVGTQLLALRLGLRRWHAVLAALVVGLHPVAIAPVSMIMARSDVVATSAAVWALLGWWSWRRELAPRGVWLAVHLVGLVLALGSKETAVALPAVITLWSLLGGDARRGRRRMLWLLLPAWLTACGTLVLRTWVLSREAPGLAAVELGLDPLRLLSSLAKYLINLWPLALSSSVRDIPVLEAESTQFWMVGAPTLVAAAALGLWALRRRDRVMLCGLAWIAVALAPVLLTAEIHVPAVEGKYPLADRWLHHALPAAAIVWTRLLQQLGRTWLDRIVQVAAAAWAGVLLFGAAAARAEFATELGMLDNEDRAYYYATPAEFRTAQDHCRFQERRVERALRRRDDRAVAAAFVSFAASCSEVSPGRWMQLLGSLERLGRFAEAEPVVRRLLAAPPADAKAQTLLARSAGRILLQVGKPVEAERWLLEAQRRGLRDCSIFILLAEASRAQGQLERAIGRLEYAFTCSGGRDPSLLLAAATWALDAGQPDRARGLSRRAANGFRLTADQQGQLQFLEQRLSGEEAAPDAAGVPVYRGR